MDFRTFLDKAPLPTGKIPTGGGAFCVFNGLIDSETVKVLWQALKLWCWRWEFRSKR